VAYIDAFWGRLGYWSLIVFTLATPMVVNLQFIRRYTYAGTALVQMSLIGAILINRLPETTSLFFSLAVNIIFSSLFLNRVFEWLTWCAFRGPDIALSTNIAAVDEFPDERELMDSSVTTSGRLKDAAAELEVLTKDAVATIQRETIGSKEPLLPTRRPMGSSGARKKSDDKRPEESPRREEASDADIIKRSANRRYTAGERLLLCFWILVLLPGSLTWAYLLNVLPMVENLFPYHPMRYWISAFYLFGVVLMSAWCGVCRTYLQILQQGVIEIREAVIDLSTRLKVQFELLWEQLQNSSSRVD
jgi:hypothetical protein